MRSFKSLVFAGKTRSKMWRNVSIIALCLFVILLLLGGFTYWHYQVNKTRITWRPIGPSPVAGLNGQAFSGRITSVVIDNSSIFIGAADGGVWRSQNDGKSWKPLTDQKASLAIGSLAVDPVHPNTLYAGTGELADSYPDADYGMGVLKSTNDGKSWSLYGKATFYGQHITKILVSPTNDATLYAAANKGIYESKDGGKQWNLLPTHTQGSPVATDIVMDPKNPSILYAGIWGYGVLKSTDGGKSWTALDLGFRKTDVQSVSLAICPNHPDVIYAAIGTNRTKHSGLYISTDGGQHWKQSRTATSYLAYSDSPKSWGGVNVWVNPKNDKNVFLGSVNLIESKDGGRTWTDLSGGSQYLNIHEDVHGLAFAPSGSLYVATDGGIYKRTASLQWRDLNTNLDITQFYSGLSGSQEDLVGGTQDNGTLIYTGVPEWAQIVDGDGGYTATDTHNPNLKYVEDPFSDLILRMDTNGQTNISPKLGKDHSFLPVLEISPHNSHILFLGAGRLYESVDSGDTWKPISPEWYVSPKIFAKYMRPYYPWFPHQKRYRNPISAVTQSKSNPNVLFVGTDFGTVYESENSGKTWSEIKDASLHLRQSVTSIRLDPNGDVYVTFGGGHVGGFHRPVMRKSILFLARGSNSWKNVTGNLPLSPVDSSLIQDGSIYAGTGQGIYVAKIGSQKWSLYGDGMPHSPVTSLVKDKNGMIAGTSGRGVWVSKKIANK